MRLIIIRGPSGSGKSTIAQLLGGEAGKTWFEADMYMINSEGNYDWHQARLAEVHDRCYKHTEFALQTGHPLVIVSNTACSLKEVQRYVELAIAHDYDYEIIRTPKPWDANELWARNTHSVPLDVIEGQIAKYVPLTPIEVEWFSLERSDNNESI